MSTLQQLKTYAADALHVPYAATPDLSALAATVDAGRTSFAAAALQVERGAIQTTGVAELSYQFFTGATLNASGLDYLLSPTGPNPNNLNSAYYQSFNIENRYINFAVNLGKNGEGAASFTSAYGALSLSDTVVKAYTTIFGAAPDAAKTSALLNDMVPNGQGGTYTRAQYFASYGLDGANGIGTKAALVGWLLAQAAKEDVGVYAQAYDAFIADLAPDGLAKFNVDLLAAYGPAPASSPAATITFGPDQSVSPSAADPALRSTAGDDVIRGTGGLNAGASVATGGGADTVTIPGLVVGSVSTGAGRATVTLGGLGSTASATPVLGAPPTQYGSVTLGGGNDTVYLNGGTASGTTLSASGTGDVLHLGAAANTTFAGAINGFQTVYLDGAGAAAGLPTAGVQTIYDDIQGGSTANAGGGTDYLTEASGQFVVMQNTGDALRLSGQDPSRVTLFLDGYRGAPTTQLVFPSFSGGVSANGGSLIASLPAPNGRVASNAVLDLHVVSDSTAGLITGYGLFTGGATYALKLPNLVISGSGALTAQIGVLGRGADASTYSFQTVDASGAGDLTIAFTVSTQTSADATAPVFRLSDGVDKITVSYAAASASAPTLSQVFVGGAGPDTFTIAGNFQTGSALANLSTTSAQTVAAPSEIDGFKKGVDHLVLDAVTTTLTPGVQAYVGAAATLTQALINVSSHVAANTGAVFEFAGDTYVYQQDATVGVNTGDGLIRLVGVTGLTLASGAGVGDIHVRG